MYKFEPIYKTTLWGGNRILPFKGIEADMQAIGESWELSGVAGNESRVATGADSGMTLTELLARDGAALLGKDNYSRFGNEFPLLVKFIDARQDLSIQVHPDDALAWERHQSKGKTEMWYVVAADKGAHLRSGFAQSVTPDEYAASVGNHTITDLLADYSVHAGDCFFLPAGRVHSIGAGAFIAEIQQTSDITYRIYDFDRRDADGNPRELHTELAKKAIDYTVQSDYRTHYDKQPDQPAKLVDCPYFTTKLYELTQPFSLPLSKLDSFVILVCVEGGGMVTDNNGSSMPLTCGETLLVPASVSQLQIVPKNGSTIKLLTSWINSPDGQ